MRSLTAALTFLAVAALALTAACDGDEEDPVLPVETTVPATGSPPDATATTETPTDTPTEAADETPTEGSDDTAGETPTVSDRITVEREGIQFSVPGDWSGAENSWVSPEGEFTVLFATREADATTEPDEMLPEGAEIIDTQQITVDWGTGVRYTIELPDEGAFERHIVVGTEDRLYDWWVAAESEEDLDQQQQPLQGILDSVVPIEDDSG